MAAREGNPFRLISALDHGAELEHKDVGIHKETS